MMLDLKDIIQIGSIFAAIVGGYFTIKVTLSRHEKEDEKEFKKIEDEFRKHDKYATEFFERIGKLEVWQSAQLEINKNVGEHWQRIENKLTAIEKLLHELITREHDK